MLSKCENGSEAEWSVGLLHQICGAHLLIGNSNELNADGYSCIDPTGDSWMNQIGGTGFGAERHALLGSNGRYLAVVIALSGIAAGFGPVLADAKDLGLAV